MWRSLPRLRLLAHESCLWILGRRISSGADSEVNSTASSSATESTLPESWGISSVVEEEPRAWMICLGRVVTDGATAWPPSHQKVSLVHKRQLRFSNLRPWSTDSAHLAKTGFTLVRGVRWEGTAVRTYLSTC